MSRPLLITDCDEVLLHMVVPFREWLDEVRDIHFTLGDFGTTSLLRHKACGTPVEQSKIGGLLDDFFATEMHRQQPIDTALETLHRIAEHADIAVLTNIDEWAHERRIEQLRKLGVDYPVYWNQGGKGRPLAALVAERSPSVTVFVDDLGQHHASVESHAPGVWRLHMVGEPELAPLIPLAARAHARIDRWADAEAWVMERFAMGPASADKPVLEQCDAGHSALDA